ncbi:50S ribosomal protein L10 [Oxynema aestuarii]|uniref:Large ribosomal subunit protein uL10 n=1 Tax=Oxynema aestuarii AP17 TaxID=2064643 RepID=A0A6H1U0V5_9CYAN|nr:50S ribosomal protein L10 [Oxynema aestuarii]QIZ72285.1 50S ribosomal protein L10 [Oxynema aestuarii AP17]RMH75947.1 MAG: 50S ribosomal protein L10 [Cyanobacteria bacterium J007]
MGRTLENKKEIVSNLKEALDESQMTVVIDYKGVSVAEITDLRNRLRQSGASCVVTKNTFMRRAIAEYEQWQPMEEFLKDSSAFLLLKDDLSSGIKAYRDFQKATKKTVLRGGVLEGKVLNEEEVKAIGDLPSKEELIAQIAGAINSLATKVAVGVKEVPASIARGIQAYADKDNDSGEAA